jgi:hypothetical protein
MLYTIASLQYKPCNEKEGLCVNGPSTLFALYIRADCEVILARLITYSCIAGHAEYYFSFPIYVMRFHFP